jgi:hypothetical protein
MVEPDKPVVKVSRGGRNLRWAARLVGLLAAVFILLMLAGESISTWNDAGIIFSFESLYVFIPSALLLIAYVLSWWKERLGGILLAAFYLLMSFTPSVHSIFYSAEGFTFYPGMFFFAAPFLLSGVLFILASVRSHETSS